MKKQRRNRLAFSKLSRLVVVMCIGGVVAVEVVRDRALSFNLVFQHTSWIDVYRGWTKPMILLAHHESIVFP